MSIAQKIRYVFLPSQSEEGAAKLRNWDLWGPLFLCLLLAITLSIGNKSSDGTTVFELVFLIVWIGGLIVTINGQLLGGTMYAIKQIDIPKCMHPRLLPVPIEPVFANICNSKICNRWLFLVSGMYINK
jgi:protein YIPF6